jgi:hypothetical protein
LIKIPQKHSKLTGEDVRPFDRTFGEKAVGHPVMPP